MTCNVGPIDRILRIVVGTALVGYGVMSLPGVLGTVSGFVGLIPLVTGIVGRCPAYLLFKIDTCSTRKIEPV